MMTLLHVLLWMTVTGAVLAGAGVLTVRWAWRRTRRAVTARLGRLTVQAQRSIGVPARRDRELPVTSAGLAFPMVRARAAVPGAPGREVAVVRRDLSADVAGADRAVAAGRRAGRPVEGLDSIAGHLREQAGALDVDLAVIAAEPDRRSRQQLLAAQQERVALLRRACAEVRRGVVLAGSATAAPLLRSLLEDLDDEVVALGLRAAAYAELSAL